MYNIEFYEKSDVSSDVWLFLEDLRNRKDTNKDARIQYKQATMYIELLQNNGTRLPENITKHVEEDIWELRPGNNRIFYFYRMENTFVLLYQFRKKRRKLPKKKLSRQNVKEMIICQERRTNKHENMEWL